MLWADIAFSDITEICFILIKKTQTQTPQNKSGWTSINTQFGINFTYF